MSIGDSGVAKTNARFPPVWLVAKDRKGRKGRKEEEEEIYL
ncbi:hypothetical protein [Nostoc sp.]